MWMIIWNRNNGFFFNSVLDIFGKKIENWFDFNKEIGYYEGYFEIFLVYLLKVRGMFI